MQNTGFVLPGFPSMGAWVSYGLGSLNDNLPTFVVLPDARGFAPNGPANWSAGFLPAAHQGTMVRAGAPNPIADLFPPEAAKFITPESERDGLALLEKLNREHQATRDGRLAARRAHRVLRAGGAAAARAPRRCSTSPARPTATQQAVRPRRAGHRGLRPQLPDRPAAARARRALRAGLERRRQRLPAPQLGQPRGPRPRPRRHGRRAWTSPPPALIKDLKAARPARRHDRPLDDRVRPDAVQPGEQGPRPQPVRLHQLAGRRRHQGRRHATARATSGRTRPSRTRRTATTCTPRCCTCSASTTRS